MKKTTLLGTLAMLFTAAQVQAQATIAAARQMAIGSVVTVRGVVTNGPELGPIRYLQDATAGIAAYSPSQLGTITLGDSVAITGTLKNYNGLLEIDPVSNVQLIASGATVPAPVSFTGNLTAAFAEQYEGMLVELNNVASITTTSGGAVTTFSGNTNYTLDGDPILAMRVNSASVGPDGLVGKPAPAASFGVVGIMSQFSPSGTGGYQLLPRLYSDISQGATPNFTSGLTVSGISTTGMTINVQTQNAGDLHLNYGLTSSTMTQQVMDMNSSTSHSIVLTGLQPATVYYVQATSTNAAGTSTSFITPVITASNSTGDFKVYFNKPTQPNVALPGNLAITIPNAIDDTVIAYINRAQFSLDIMMYNWSNGSGISNIATAVNAAHNRGVDVRVISDGGTTNNALPLLLPGINRIERTTSSGLMHNKIMIIDEQSPSENDDIVFTGSTNWTANQINTDANSALFIQDQALARVMKLEFDEMWGGTTTSTGNPVFGASKSDNTPHYLRIGGRNVEVYFSPSDNTNTKLLETIASADNDFEFASMVFTRADLANAFKTEYQQGNISLCSGGLIKDTTTGPFMTMKNVMNNRLQKYNGSGIMHHKYLIVDAGMPSSDPLVWVGSHNWSNAANNTNDENTLVIHDLEIANLYYQEWVKRMEDQNAGLVFCNFGITGLPTDAANPKNNIVVFPNPSEGQFSIQLPQAAKSNVSVTMFDVTGRVVYQHTATAGVDFISVNSSNLPAGIYSLQLTGEGIQSIGRIVIE
jgi:hypothetical protein